MARMGVPSSRSFGSAVGAPGSNTELGPPERMMPFGANCLTKPKSVPRGGMDLAVDVCLPHPAGDELGELRAVVEDQDTVHAPPPPPARYQGVGSSTSP